MVWWFWVVSLFGKTPWIQIKADFLCYQSFLDWPQATFRPRPWAFAPKLLTQHVGRTAYVGKLHGTMTASAPPPTLMLFYKALIILLHTIQLHLTVRLFKRVEQKYTLLRFYPGNVSLDLANKRTLHSNTHFPFKHIQDYLLLVDPLQTLFYFTWYTSFYWHCHNRKMCLHVTCAIHYSKC